MFHEHTLSSPAGPLNYAAGPPSGPPLILLHGVTRCWQDWDLLVPALAARWRVLALDSRGHGRSCRVPGRYRVVDYVEDAAALARQCSEPPVIFGHSLGAMVALAAAAEPSLAVRALILEDPPFETMGSRIRQTALHGMFAAMQQLVRQDLDVPTLTRGLAEVRLAAPGAANPVRLGDVRDPASLRFSARCLRRIDPEVLTPIVEENWLIGYYLSRLVKRINCPTLLLQADTAAGGMLTDDDAEAVEKGLRECSRVPFSGVGHLLHWMDTEKVLRLATGFLNSLDQ